MSMPFFFALALLAVSAWSYGWTAGHLTRQGPEEFGGKLGLIATAVFFALAITVVVLYYAKGSLASRVISTGETIVISLVLWKAFGLSLRLLVLIGRFFLWIRNSHWYTAKLSD